MTVRILACPMDLIDGARYTRPWSLIDPVRNFRYFSNTVSAPGVDWCVSVIFGKDFTPVNADPDCITCVQFPNKTDNWTTRTPNTDGMPQPVFNTRMASLTALTGVSFDNVNRNTTWGEIIDLMTETLQPGNKISTSRPQATEDNR